MPFVRVVSRDVQNFPFQNTEKLFFLDKQNHVGNTVAKLNFSIELSFFVNFEMVRNIIDGLLSACRGPNPPRNLVAQINTLRNNPRSLIKGHQSNNVKYYQFHYDYHYLHNCPFFVYNNDCSNFKGFQIYGIGVALNPRGGNIEIKFGRGASYPNNPMPIKT